MKTLLGTALLFTAAIALPLASRADTPGKHPHYLTARQNLRIVQWLMRTDDDPQVVKLLHKVDLESANAIRIIDDAAAVDKTDTREHAETDKVPDRKNRLKRAMELLQDAKKDINAEEDTPDAKKWRNAATQHINTAMEELQQAGRELKMDMTGW